jgi:hypothetical protein
LEKVLDFPKTASRLISTGTQNIKDVPLFEAKEISGPKKLCGIAQNLAMALYTYCTVFTQRNLEYKFPDPNDGHLENLDLRVLGSGLITHIRQQIQAILIAEKNV